MQITVSLDGPEHVNDLLRVNHAGRGSYARVIRAVRPLLAARPTRARVTVTKHCLDMEMIVDHLLAAGFYEVGLTPVNSTDPRFALELPCSPEVERSYFSSTIVPSSTRVRSAARTTTRYR